MTTVTVLGSGIMASALSFPLTDNGHEVRLVGTHLDREIIDSIKETGVHPNLDLKLSESVRAYQLEEAEEAFDGADIAMSGVNSFGVRWASEQFATLLKPGMMVIAVTKGMDANDEGNLRILPEVLAEQVPEDVREQVSWSAIVGPAIAGEVAVRRDTSVIFTGEDTDVLKKLAETFRTDHYHVWTGTDLIGCEGMRGDQELLRVRGRFHGRHSGSGGRAGSEIPKLQLRRRTLRPGHTRARTVDGDVGRQSTDTLRTCRSRRHVRNQHGRTQRKSRSVCRSRRTLLRGTERADERRNAGRSRGDQSHWRSVREANGAWRSRRKRLPFDAPSVCCCR